MKSLIQKLTQTTGPSGFEDQVRDLIKAELASHVDELRVDNLGNLIARKGTRRDGGLDIMVAAHMDELGIMVTHIDENGFARFTTLGTVYPRNTAGGRVRFLNGARGVIGMEPNTNRSLVTSIDKMYIDLGVRAKKDCPVAVGDVAAFERTFTDLGDRIVSKALDNRVGVAALIETIKSIKSTPHCVFAVFTVQEEVGTRGAGAAAFGINPNIGFSLDVTSTGDTPNAKLNQVSLGGGPAIKIKDTAMIADPRIVAWMQSGAKSAKIPTQPEILVGGWTDARVIQLTRAGIPAGSLSIPARYIHSPSEMVDINDVNHTVKLLTHLLSHPAAPLEKSL
ncbi:MAG: M42 family metallopeptidase [Anaerolineae bacterium]|nr:M42 family metallopeptidase [Anaerolineae bacterium]